MNKKIIIVLILFLINISYTSYNVGIEEHFNEGIYSISTSGNSISNSKSVDDIYSNPAVKKNEDIPGITVGMNKIYYGLYHYTIGIKYPLWLYNSYIAYSFNHFIATDIEVRDDNNKYEKTTSAKYFYNYITYSCNIMKNLYVGTNLKFIYTDLIDKSNTAFAIDIGTQYKYFDINAGLNFKNLISTNYFGYSYDRSLLFSVSKDIMEKIYTGINFNINLNKFQYSDFGIGIEYQIRNNLRIYSGISNVDISLGLKYDINPELSFHYTYNYDYDIGSNNIALLSYDFKQMPVFKKKEKPVVKLPPKPKLSIEEKIKKEKEKKTAIERQELLERGIKYYNEKRFSLAEAIFTVILDYDNKNPVAKQYLDKITTHFELIEKYENAKRDFEQGNFEKALKQFTVILEAADSTTALYEMSQEILNNIQDALTEKAIDKKRLEDANRLYRKGLEEFANEKYEQAIDFWERSLQKNPKHEKAREQILIAKPLLAKLAEERNRRIKLKELLFQLRKYFNLQKYNKVVEYANKILDIDSNNQDALDYMKRTEKLLSAQRAERLARRKKLQKGKELLEQANQLITGNDFKNAIKLLNKIPKGFGFEDDINKTLLKIEKIKSKQEQQKILENETISAVDMAVYKSVKKLFKERGDLVTPGEKLYPILKKKPEFPGAKNVFIRSQVYRGIAEYSKGNFQEAIRIWKRIIDIYPNLENVKKHIERAEIRLK